MTLLQEQYNDIYPVANNNENTLEKQFDEAFAQGLQDLMENGQSIYGLTESEVISVIKQEKASYQLIKKALLLFETKWSKLAGNGFVPTGLPEEVLLLPKAQRSEEVLAWLQGLKDNPQAINDFINEIEEVKVNKESNDLVLDSNSEQVSELRERELLFGKLIRNAKLEVIDYGKNILGLSESEVAEYTIFVDTRYDTVKDVFRAVPQISIEEIANVLPELTDLITPEVLAQDRFERYQEIVAKLSQIRNSDSSLYKISMELRKNNEVADSNQEIVEYQDEIIGLQVPAENNRIKDIVNGLGFVQYLDINVQELNIKIEQSDLSGDEKFWAKILYNKVIEAESIGHEITGEDFKNLQSLGDVEINTILNSIGFLESLAVSDIDTNKELIIKLNRATSEQNFNAIFDELITGNDEDYMPVLQLVDETKVYGRFKYLVENLEISNIEANHLFKAFVSLDRTNTASQIIAKVGTVVAIEFLVDNGLLDDVTRAIIVNNANSFTLKLVEKLDVNPELLDDMRNKILEKSVDELANLNRKGVNNDLTENDINDFLAINRSHIKYKISQALRSRFGLVDVIQRENIKNNLVPVVELEIVKRLQQLPVAELQPNVGKRKWKNLFRKNKQSIDKLQIDLKKLFINEGGIDGYVRAISCQHPELSQHAICQVA